MSTSREYLLSVQSVAKAFGGNQVLRDVSFNVQRGEIVGLLGPNGSGKSTLLNCITGFEAVDGGAIALGARRIERLSAWPRPKSTLRARSRRSFAESGAKWT